MCHLLEDGAGLLEPARDRAILEAAVGLAMAGIIEPDQRPALGRSPFGERCRLGRDHVRLEALQPQQARGGPGLQQAGDAAAGRGSDTARADREELR